MVEAKDTPEVLDRFNSELDLVEILARQVRRTVASHVELDELVSYGREGLLEAARRFDPGRGVSFRSYANYRVRGAMIDGVRAMAALPRRVHERIRGLDAARRVSEGAVEDLSAGVAPGTTRADAERALNDHLASMATAMAAGIVAQTVAGEGGETVAVSPGEDPEERAAKKELVELVSRSIEELPEQEAILLRRHYLEGDRFDHVAAELGLSKSWASRIHTRAIKKLAKRLRRTAG